VLREAGWLPKPSEDSRMKKKEFDAGEVVAIAIASDRGTFVFHGAVVKGETELHRLHRLYTVYSRSLPPRSPFPLRSMGDLDASYLIEEFASAAPAFARRLRAALAAPLLPREVGDVPPSVAGSSAASIIHSTTSTAVTDRSAVITGAGLLASVKAKAPAGSDVKVSYKPPDLEAAGALIASCLANVSYVAPEAAAWTATDWLEFKERAEVYAAELRHRPSLAYVCVHVDGQLVVLVVLDEKYPWNGVRCTWLEQLMVHRDYRRAGVGRVAMGFFLDSAKNSGADVAALDVHKTNVGAIDFYGKVGWTYQLESGLTGPGGQWQPTITLFLPLTAQGAALRRLPKRAVRPTSSDIGPGPAGEVPVGLVLLEDRHGGDPLLMYDYAVPLNKHYTLQEKEQLFDDIEARRIEYDARFIAATPRPRTGGLWVDAKGCLGGAINRARGSGLAKNAELGPGLLVRAWCRHMSGAAKRKRCNDCIIRAGSEVVMPYGMSHKI
jgi:GNAT superfamily N-acetyltransferase